MSSGEAVVVRFERVIIGGVALVALAACSESSESSSASDPDDVSSTVPADDTTAPTTSPSTTAAPTTTAAATTTAASTVAPTTTPAGGLTAACLEGDWVLPSDATNDLLTTLLPGVPLTATGSMSLAFSGESVEQFVDIVVTISVPGGSVSGQLDQRFAGTYTIDDGAIEITNDVSEGGWGDITGQIGGVSVDIPTPPFDDLPALGGGPATCTDDRLSIEYTSGLTDAVAAFERA